MKDNTFSYLIIFSGIVLLLLASCLRPIARLPDDDFRSTYFYVTPNFICNSPECIVKISYKIDDLSQFEVSSVLSVTGPNGEQSTLKTEQPTHNIIEYEATIDGDDSAVWTAGPGVYIFSLLVLGEGIAEGGELQLTHEVVLFEDSHSIPHSVAITVNSENQIGVKDLVEIGEVEVEDEKFENLYHVCSKGIVITGISYDEALSVFQANTDYPEKLEIKGRYKNGNNLFSHSINPGDSFVLSPIELSEPVVIETTALPGQIPYPQSSTVRWKLSFQLGCLVSN